MGRQPKKHWFWAWTLLGTVQKEREGDPRAHCEVWKNLIIVNADTEREALQKAKRIGKSEAGDCRGSLRLNGKPAICKFLGIADMGLVHDELKDGAEIIWQLQRCTHHKATSLAKDEALLLSRARKEMENVV